MARITKETDRLKDVTWGTIAVRPMSNDVVIDGKVVDILPRQVEVLAELVRAKGKPVTKRYLARSLWSEANMRREPSFPDHNITVWIHFLRKALSGTSVSIESLPDPHAVPGRRGPQPVMYRLIIDADK